MRNILDTFGLRSDDPDQQEFTPYFMYQIGTFKRDYYLHFEKQPFPARYYNEIFNKLYSFKTTTTAVEYLKFHYDAYFDKPTFLEFLKQEISSRRRTSTQKSQISRLEDAQGWLNDTLEKYRSESQHRIQQVIDHSIKSFRENTSGNEDKLDEFLTNLSEKLAAQYEKLAEGYVAGNIRVSHHKYLQSLIELFYTLQNLQEPSTGGRGQQRLFSIFTGTDLASLLRLHFADFKAKQLNTIQKEVATITKDFDTGSDRFKRLDKALREFIFGK